MADQLVMTIVYTILTLVILFLIKFCNDKRKELKKLKEDNEQASRVKAHLEDMQQPSEQEIRDRRLRETAAAGDAEGEKAFGHGKFDE